jgi:hypothetical protein
MPIPTNVRPISTTRPGPGFVGHARSNWHGNHRAEALRCQQQPGVQRRLAAYQLEVERQQKCCAKKRRREKKAGQRSGAHSAAPK